MIMVSLVIIMQLQRENSDDFHDQNEQIGMVLIMTKK